MSSSQVARSSPLHQSIIREGIAAGLAVTPPPQPAALGAVLDLFYELSIATESPPPQGKLRPLFTALDGGNRGPNLLSLRE